MIVPQRERGCILRRPSSPLQTATQRALLDVHGNHPPSAPQKAARRRLAEAYAGALNLVPS